MKLHRIDLEDERPKSILVEMTVDEAIVIGKYCGNLSGVTSPNPEATSSIYWSLVGSFFNRFWGDGINGAQRGEDE